MYLMYVDESGDCGMPSDGSPTNLFCLSGLVVHELCWRSMVEELTRFRHWLMRRYGVFTDEELHVGAMLAKPSTVSLSYRGLRKYQRLAIVRHFADAIARLHDVRIISVVVDKRSSKVLSKTEVFRKAWYALFQRFENTIRRRNFPGPSGANECGIVFPDDTDGRKLRQFLDSMRVSNPLRITQHSGSHFYVDEPVEVIIEHPILRDSRESYLIQAADCAAYLLKQSIEPSSFMKQHGGHAYFRRLKAVLCTQASYKDPNGMGVVRL